MANTLKFGNGQWATKVGSTLAYNDEGGNFKPLPFNFTRSTSATRVNKDGLIEMITNNKPRIDFLNDSNGALLLEPTRSNLYTYSEDFSNVSWLKSIATVTLTSEISPDGTNDSVYSFVGADANLYTNTQSTGSEYTISFYVKSNGNGKDVFKLRLGSNFSQVFTATNEWVRYTFNATASSQVFGISSNDIDSDILIWGAQLEAGSYATSYIPTQGATATRVVDACNNAGNNQVINSTEGVLYVEAKVKTDTIFAANSIGISDGTDANRLSIIMYGNINSIRSNMNVGGVSQFDFNLSGYSREQYYKIAVSYKVNDCKIFINGTKISTDTSATMPSIGTFDRLNLDLGQGLYDFYGNVKDVKIYNTSLTDLQLQQLTTL